MEGETQCCGMLHVFRLNLIPTQPEDNPLVHPSIRTYSAYITDIIIPACCNVAPPPQLSFPRAGEWALLAPGQITQSISSQGGGRAAKERWGRNRNECGNRGVGVTEAGRKSPALDG